jgi:hypothetical protein
MLLLNHLPAVWKNTNYILASFYHYQQHTVYFSCSEKWKIKNKLTVRVSLYFLMTACCVKYEYNLAFPI